MLSRSGLLHWLPRGVLQRWSPCLYSRPLPGLQVLSCLPWSPKAKQAAQKQPWLWAQWGHHTKLVGQGVPQRGEMQESDGFVPGGLGGGFTWHLPRGCLALLLLPHAHPWLQTGILYRMEYGAQEGLWGGDPDLPPNAFPFPLPRTADCHTRGPQFRGGLAPQEPGHSRL